MNHNILNEIYIIESRILESQIIDLPNYRKLEVVHVNHESNQIFFLETSNGFEEIIEIRHFFLYRCSIERLRSILDYLIGTEHA